MAKLDSAQRGELVGTEIIEMRGLQDNPTEPSEQCGSCGKSVLPTAKDCPHCKQSLWYNTPGPSAYGFTILGIVLTIGLCMKDHYFWAAGAILVTMFQVRIAWWDAPMRKSFEPQNCLGRDWEQEF